MKKAISIKLTRAEGRVWECSEPHSPKTLFAREETATHDAVDVWREADRVLFLWSSTAPKDCGCNKCDFLVTYEDGETYEGRYDLVHFTREAPSLKRHMQSFLDFHAGTYCPAHMTEERYRDYLALSRNQGLAKQAKEFLATYEVGGV